MVVAVVLLISCGSLAWAETHAPAPSQPAVPPETSVSEDSLEEDEVLEEGEAAEELSRQFRLGEPGLAGVVVDRTITMMGKTFYRRFSQLSADSHILTRTTLSINERPDARWGSQVWVAENNRILFQATLPPRLSDIDRYAEAAVEQVEQLLVQRSIMEALESDPDLADEEI
ncbi:CsgE family curli-type amyloid fiber assembly protein [Billgrantia saliphila]|uniref:CsgE family curli-type amyloid fiber assembly protein n=1 Tax=Billgrantia saliphila TaxID=1848458 RepID=UPI000CE2B9DA|nr:CsgE family curli-type amyloid fiber assembly protein [Halomonas saliphila]